jgi:hypothetical protein
VWPSPRDFLPSANHSSVGSGASTLTTSVLDTVLGDGPRRDVEGVRWYGIVLCWANS